VIDRIVEPLIYEARNSVTIGIEEAKQPAKIFVRVIAVDGDFSALWGASETVRKLTLRVSGKEKIFYCLCHLGIELSQDSGGAVEGLIMVYLTVDEPRPPNDLHAIHGL
jgi:hypothetical protein